jgi:uncharacterized integral membrane protein (TIGR00698 family)
MLAAADIAWASAQAVRRIAAGVATCVLIALAATFVATLHSGPPMLYALFFGTAFHYQSTEARTAPGIDFCSRTLLRWGVGLLGARITLEQIAGLGAVTAGVVVFAVLSTLLCARLLARALNLSWSLGLLAGGASAICGASAALAIAAVLPRERQGTEREVLVVVVMATLLSTLAMLFYPLIARSLQLPPSLAGLFIGGSIHDVAQVVVAGYSLNPAAGDAASVVKLFRVSLLVLVVLGVSLACGSWRAQPSAPMLRRVGALVPGFLWLFVGLAALNSLGASTPALQAALGQGSRCCLMLGVAGLGVKTSFTHLARTGWRPAALMVITAGWLAGVLLVAVLLMR